MIRKLLAVAAIATAALAVPATAAFASPAGNAPQGQQPWQQDKNMCPGGDNGQWGSKNNDSNCGCQQQWGQNRDVFPFRSQCGQCHEVTTWVESWTWTWRHHHVFRVPVWHKVVTWKCELPKGDGPGNGDPGNHCQAVTFSNSSTGTQAVTELPGGPWLTNGEEVAYNGVSPAQDYTVTDVMHVGGTTTFELVGPLPGTAIHTEGTNPDWQLTTVCQQHS